MAKRRKGKSTPPHPTTSPSPDGAGTAAPAPTWLEMHGRDLKFLGIFALLMAVYYAATTTSAVNDRFFPWYLTKTAQVSGTVVDALGFDGLQIRGKTLYSTRGVISVERGCDAIAPTALFISAVIASPAMWSFKIIGIFGGVFILMVVNIIRVITLFWTRVFWLAVFDVMHLDIWQFLFILLAILLWAIWASWASKQARRRADVPA